MPPADLVLSEFLTLTFVNVYFPLFHIVRALDFYYLKKGGGGGGGKKISKG